MISLRPATPALFVPALAFLVLAASLACPGVAEAAELARPPAPGERVRVSLRDEPQVTGTLLASRIAALELALEPDSTRREIADALIAGIEVERRHGHAGTGALVGFIVGGIGTVGATAFLTSKEDVGVAPIGVFFAGALIGTAIGALIGEAVTSPRWDAARRP